jgi:hypothetical protein
MHRTLYRYQLKDGVPLQDVQETLFLAVLATESLHGGSQVRLDAAFCLDEERRSCVIDADTQVGQDLARIFTGFLRREFGEQAFRVERLAPEPRQPEPAGAAS